MTAYSPTARPLGCPVSEENGTFYASFQPEEAGEWKIHVTYDGQDIEHSPFKCMVFNPRAIVVSFFLSYFLFQTYIYIIEKVGLVTQSPPHSHIEGSTLYILIGYRPTPKIFINRLS